MIDVEQSDIGRKVLYLAPHGAIEEGILVNFNSAPIRDRRHVNSRIWNGPLQLGKLKIHDDN
jgi:hypothetical protein